MITINGQTPSPDNTCANDVIDNDVTENDSWMNMHTLIASRPNVVALTRRDATCSVWTGLYSLMTIRLVISDISKPFFTVTSRTVAVTEFMDFMWSYTFVECGVLYNFRRPCDPWTWTRTRTWGPRTWTRTWGRKTRTRTCKLVFEDPRGLGLSSMTATLGNGQ